MKYAYKLESVRYIIPIEEWNKYRELTETDNEAAELLRTQYMADWKLHFVWYPVGGPVDIEFIREHSATRDRKEMCQPPKLDDVGSTPTV